VIKLFLKLIKSKISNILVQLKFSLNVNEFADVASYNWQLKHL